MDLREWTASILMATGTNKMAMISTKRARQRAKKAAADGGSHQKALDGIARAEGHAHWGAKLAYADEGSASARPVDFFDREWLRAQGDDMAEIHEFVIRVIGGTADTPAATAIARMLVGAWFDGIGVDAPDFPSFIEERIGDARIADDEKAGEAAMVGTPYRPSWRMRLVEMLRDMCAAGDAADAAVRIMRGVDADAFDKALEHVRTVARKVDAEPIWGLTSSGVEGLRDDLIVRLALEIWGGRPPRWNALATASRILVTVEPSGMYRAVEDARMAIGDDFNMVWRMMSGLRLDVARGSRILGMLMRSMDESEHILLSRYRDSLELLRTFEHESVMAAWLGDSIAKVSEGRMPFSFNPLAGGDGDAARQATLALITLQSRDRLYGSFDPEPRVTEGAIHLVEDIARVIVEAPNIAEIEDGLVASYPSVSRVLGLCIRQPGQFELFASLNRLDPDLIDRLRKGLADDEVRMLASQALVVFDNAAMMKAAG